MSSAALKRIKKKLPERLAEVSKTREGTVISAGEPPSPDDRRRDQRASLARVDRLDAAGVRPLRREAEILGLPAHEHARSRRDGKIPQRRRRVRSGR